MHLAASENNRPSGDDRLCYDRASDLFLSPTVADLDGAGGLTENTQKPWGTL